MYTQFEAAEFLHRAYNASYEDQFKAIEKLADEFETPGNRAWTQIVDDIIAWMQQGLPRKEVITWNLLGGKGYDTNKLAKQLTMIQNWVLKFHKGEVDVSPITYTLEAFWEDSFDSKGVGFVVNDEYDENRNPIGEATYHKNKEEKKEKEWLSRIQENARSQDNILRAIFNKAAGQQNTTAGGAMVSKSIRRGQFWIYMIKKLKIPNDQSRDRNKVEKIVKKMYGHVEGIHLSEAQFLNIMRGARRVIEDNNAKGSDSRKNPADTPWWYDFYEAFVMDEVQSKEILETFKAHDRNQSGLIELSELREDYEINKQIGGEAIKSMDRYDTDGDGKLDLKEFRYWHWDTNTLDQPSPEEIQERDRLVMLIKNLKDAFSTFTNDIEPELEDYPLAPAESKFMSAEPQIKDREPGSKKNPFTNKKNALAECIKQIEDEGNSALDGDEAVVNFGFVYVLRQKYWIIYINNLASKLKNLPHGLQSRFNILTYGEIKEYCQPYGSSGSTSGNSSEARSGRTIWKFLVERGLEKNPPESEIFGPTFDDEGPATPPQSPKRISIDTRDVIIEDSTAKRNKENIFKILMEKYMERVTRVQQIESLKAEYSRLKDIAKEFIQGAEEDLA